MEQDVVHRITGSAGIGDAGFVRVEDMVPGAEHWEGVAGVVAGHAGGGEVAHGHTVGGIRGAVEIAAVEAFPFEVFEAVALLAVGIGIRAGTCREGAGAGGAAHPAGIGRKGVGGEVGDWVIG